MYEIITMDYAGQRLSENIYYFLTIFFGVKINAFTISINDNVTLCYYLIHSLSFSVSRLLHGLLDISKLTSMSLSGVGS